MTWRTRAALLGIALPAAAHMVSISTGEMRIQATQGHYEMRMPLYEVAHVRNPESALLDAVRFRSGGADARPVEKRCRTDEAAGEMICEARYVFPANVDVLEVSSTLHQVTVPNHVHLLRAVRDGALDQAVLELSFQRTELRFRPPTLLETVLRQATGGALRAVGGPAQWLFFVALAIAARTRRELAALLAMFAGGEVVACLALPFTGWQPAPQFVEAACALTVAYLAVETLFLAQAGQRWLVVGVLGLFHGLYLALFASGSSFSAAWVLAGALGVEALLILAAGLLVARIARVLPQFTRVAAAAMLVTGLAWFVVRLRG